MHGTDWMNVPPEKCICRNHIPQCDGIWGWGLERLLEFNWEWGPFDEYFVVKSLSCIQLFTTLRTAAHQASLSITNFLSLLKLTSIQSWCHPTILSSVIPFSSCLQSFPASGAFLMSWLFASGGQSVGVSASASVLPMNTQDRPPLRWTGWISLQSKGLSRVFSKKKVFSLSFHGPTLTSIHYY